MAHTTPAELITRREAAERLGVSIPTITRALAANRLTKYVKGNGYNVLLDAREVDELMAVTPVSGPATQSY